MSPSSIFFLLVLGFHGSGIVTTHTDSLLQQGLYLNNYYTLCSCTQSRISFMTGKYPYRNGIYDVVRPQVTYGMSVSDTTLAQSLRDGGGYSAHAVGKWHLGNAYYEQTPTFRGFESFFGYYGPGQLDYYSHTTTEDGQIAYGLRYDPQEYCGENCSTVRFQRQMRGGKSDFLPCIFVAKRLTLQLKISYSSLWHERLWTNVEITILMFLLGKRLR